MSPPPPNMTEQLSSMLQRTRRSPHLPLERLINQFNVRPKYFLHSMYVLHSHVSLFLKTKSSLLSQNKNTHLISLPSLPVQAKVQQRKCANINNRGIRVKFFLRAGWSPRLNPKCQSRRVSCTLSQVRSRHSFLSI